MATADFCPECGAAVAGAKFCPECGVSTALGIAQAEATPDERMREELVALHRTIAELQQAEAEATPVVLSHEEQVDILQSTIAELRKQGWKICKQQPTPYEVCLTRKSGLFARQFMPLWVEEDGSLRTHEIFEGGRIQWAE